MSQEIKLPNKGHKISEIRGYINNQYKDCWIDKANNAWSIFFSENHMDERLSVRSISEEDLMENFRLMLDTLDESKVFKTFKDNNGRTLMYDSQNQNLIVMRAFADFKEIHLITVYNTSRPDICRGGLNIFFENDFIRFLFINQAGKITGKKQAYISAPIPKI